MDAGLAAEMCPSLGSAVQPLTGRLPADDVYGGDEEAAEAARPLTLKSSKGPEGLNGN